MIAVALYCFIICKQLNALYDGKIAVTARDLHFLEDRLKLTYSLLKLPSKPYIYTFPFGMQHFCLILQLKIVNI